ncbi:MAG: helix-turn-helix transcriptional regulator [Acidimicrobiales bacterium]|nr:helix-turn-helix transcriptional regulator [Acidimicrobiales bacterium]
MRARARPDEPATDLVLLRKAKDRIDRAFDQPLDVESIARDVGMSAGHFSRRFREEYGEPPYSYVMTRRVERAMALLRGTDRSVTDICFAVGFSSLGTFSTRFSELVGMAPSAYRDEAPDWQHELAPCVAMRVTKPVRNREATSGAAPYGAPHGDHDPPELPAAPRP